MRRSYKELKKKRSERQKRKGKIYLSECRVLEKSKDKKAFLSEQCKEIEESDTMGKTAASAAKSLQSLQEN